MGAATLNVRMPKELKRNGDWVLEREGITVSEAVRQFYRFLETEQAVPDWLAQYNEKSEDAFEKRRKSIDKLVGIVALPADFDLEVARRERLARYDFDWDDDEAML